MPELLLEILSEEIPARMQAAAARLLAREVSGALAEAGLLHEDAQGFATPRRLALYIPELPAHSPATVSERRGPRVGAPEKAIAGFLRAAGLDSLDEAEIVSDPKKGDYYLARSEKPGRPAAEIVAEVIPEVLAKFHWPKSMRWGEAHFRWVRPIHGLLCLLGGKVVPFTIPGLEGPGREALTPGVSTRGHRFMAPEPFKVRGFADYCEKLRAAKVILDGKARADAIAQEARTLAKAHGLALIEDAALLEENAGLVEWPVVLMGSFDEAFLTLPPEVLITTLKAHQKCFALRRPRGQKLANRFLLVANLEADDGGKAIIAGNERVIRARLSDARFFWEKDLARPLDDMAEALSGVTFHEKLGTMAERAERIATLAARIAPMVGAEGEKAARAAHLAKADLVSEMVGEFPELQGLMGRYYAEAAGEDAAVAEAIEAHYRPQGPTDAVPMAPVSIAVALADKLDMLTGLWAIGEKPTGSKDPYAVRRAALGVIRIVLENELRLSLRPVLLEAFKPIGLLLDLKSSEEAASSSAKRHESLSLCHDITRNEGQKAREAQDLAANREGSESRALDAATRHGETIIPELLAFFADRLRVHLREQGARHDLIDAVFALGDEDDLLMLVKRIEALGRFLETDDGESLRAGVKRAESILRIEEKKDKCSYDAAPDPALFAAPEEKALHEAIGQVTQAAEKAIAREDFEAAMAALARLRAPVDAFFEKVTVNADDPELRKNRLRLLSRIRAATRRVADFSRIAGT